MHLLTPTTWTLSRTASTRVEAGLRLVTLLVVVSAALGCEATLAPADEAPLDERAQRRALLESALWMPELPYAQKLLNGYALDGQGWDLLPVMDERSGPLRLSDGAALAAGDAMPLDGLVSVRSSGDSLGEAVFRQLPMRGGPWLDWLAGQPELWADVGLETNDAGEARGLVRYVDAWGDPHVAVTCALCHPGGRGSRTINLGQVRALWREAIGLPPGPAAHWGPGMVDVTDDGVDSPTRIPDLYGLNDAQYLNSSGVIEVTDPAVLAIRFETQFILGHELLSRPERDLIAALADYVRTVEPDTSPDEPPQAFLTHCAGCHAPDRSFSGGLVAIDRLHTDATVALTPARGTGYYKVPSLRGVSLGGPYFHDGSAPDLETVLSDHPQSPLSADERSVILNFLLTL